MAEERRHQSDMKIEELGLLAELAYLKLEDYSGKYSDLNALKEFMHERDKGGISLDKLTLHRLEKMTMENPNNTPAMKRYVMDELSKHYALKGGIGEGRQDDMLKILNKYEIIDFGNDEGVFKSGFQGMLLKERGTDNYVISFRGTAGLKDLGVDAPLANLPFVGNHNYQLDEAKEFANAMIEKYHINKESLTLTGHSLGGILVQQVSAEVRIPGYTYNALGADELVDKDSLIGKIINLVTKGTSLSKENADYAKKNVVNISYVDGGIMNGDPLSNLATNLNGSEHLGRTIYIFGENKGLGAHSIAGLNDTIAHHNDIAEKFLNQDLQGISDVYRIIGYGKAETIFNELGVYKAPHGSLRFEEMDSKELTGDDFNDPAKLYGLVHDLPYIIRGLDAYYNNISEKELDNMLYHINDRNGVRGYNLNSAPYNVNMTDKDNHSLIITGTGGRHFTDGIYDYYVEGVNSTELSKMNEHEIIRIKHYGDSHYTDGQHTFHRIPRVYSNQLGSNSKNEEERTEIDKLAIECMEGEPFDTLAYAEEVALSVHNPANGYVNDNDNVRD